MVTPSYSLVISVQRLWMEEAKPLKDTNKISRALTLRVTGLVWKPIKDKCHGQTESWLREVSCSSPAYATKWGQPDWVRSTWAQTSSRARWGCLHHGRQSGVLTRWRRFWVPLSTLHKLNCIHLLTYIQAHLGGIAGRVPDHHNEAGITVKRVARFGVSQCI